MVPLQAMSDMNVMSTSKLCGEHWLNCLPLLANAWLSFWDLEKIGAERGHSNVFAHLDLPYVITAWLCMHPGGNKFRFPTRCAHHHVERPASRVVTLCLS